MTAEPTRDEIASVAIECLATELRISTAEIDRAAVLRELPGADSMKMLRVVSKLERQWDVEFDDEAIFSVKTVDELIDLVGASVAGDLAVS